MKTKSAKAKGRSLQNWTCKMVSAITGIKHGKDEDIEPRIMGCSGVDVILRNAAFEMFPFSIECKNQQRLNVHEAIKQAKANQIKGTDWLLITKRNRERPNVTLDAEAFFDIYGSIIDHTWKY
jgi:hypothetical protein